MKKVYLLAYGEQSMQFSFDKFALENLIEKDTLSVLPSQDILEVFIDESLANQLHTPYELNFPPKHDISNHYYEDREKILSDRGMQHLRIYIIFDTQQRCFWSPSGNNLNSFYTRNPHEYLSEAIRVEINSETYVKLYGYLEWSCDNF